MQANVKPTLVIVYLANELPKYAILNISQLRCKFPRHKIVLISDLDRNMKIARKLGVSYWKCQDSRNLWPQVSRNLNHPNDFRNGFWQLTTTRFKAIDEYIKASNEQVLQIEADVWLSSSFPIDKFSNLSRIAFTIDKISQGSAAILWIPNSILSSRLIDFAQNSVKKYAGETDMTILAKFAQMHTNLTELLPSTIESNYEVNEFHGIFDPSTYGMFFIGQDARNHKGKRIIFQQPLEHLARVDLISFNWHDKKLYVSNNKQEIELFCLHNHGKVKEIFRDEDYFMKSRIKSMNGKTQIEFDFLSFVYLAKEAIKRRMKRFAKNTIKALLRRDY